MLCFLSTVRMKISYSVSFRSCSTHFKNGKWNEISSTSFITASAKCFFPWCVIANLIFCLNVFCTETLEWQSVGIQNRNLCRWQMHKVVKDTKSTKREQKSKVEFRTWLMPFLVHWVVCFFSLNSQQTWDSRYGCFDKSTCFHRK